MHKDGLKIAVIGGGSSYTPELIEGFIERFATFSVKDVYLVDIEAGREKLRIIAALARRMVAKANLPIRIHETLHRREAIAGADFVLTQLRVGLLDARARDERIPLRYNRIGQETTGAGGFAKALRTIPVILEIAREVEELAPEAFLINFTNPAGAVTEAVLKHTNVKAIGLCNLPIGMRMQVARALDVEASRVYTEMIGINHLNWTTKVVLDGQDITARFLQQVVTSSSFNMQNIPDLQWDPDLIRALQALPCGYLRYYYMTEDMLAEEKQAAAGSGTRAEVVKKVEAELFELYKDPDLAVKPPQLAQRGGAYYSLAAVNLMESIVTNKQDIQTVNVRNNGVLPFLPADASVELNCVIDGRGAHPIQVESNVSVHMRGLLQVVKAYEELTVAAAVFGDWDSALQALTIHPLVSSAGIAKDILHDILAENRDYLPQFR